MTSTEKFMKLRNIKKGQINKENMFMNCNLYILEISILPCSTDSIQREKKFQNSHFVESDKLILKIYKIPRSQNSQNIRTI